MVDYYSTLLRAVTAPGAGDAQWRRNIYDRTREMLARRLRALQPPPPLHDIAAEEAALEAAIERVEAQIAETEADAAAAEASSGSWIETDRGPIPTRSRWRGAAMIAIAVVAAALGAGGYLFWSGRPHRDETPPIKSAAQTGAPPAARSASTPRTAKDGELAPGVDGGSSDPDQPYVFRRQPTFYRTLQPVGTVIIDKLQRFLYLIQPNNVALRYGIAVGEHCENLVGLHHIASMAEWPPWQPPPEAFNRNPAALAGGPGNPLGARLLDLDDNTSRIHGTNAPKTIGNAVAFGCIRLVNDDIVDLYSRVRLSTPVVVN
jgi:lipoprotein-anchoring transpeptidase ErfK/SrfK